MPLPPSRNKGKYMSYDVLTRTPVWLRQKLETLLESPSPAQPTPPHLCPWGAPSEAGGSGQLIYKATTILQAQNFLRGAYIAPDHFHCHWIWGVNLFFEWVTKPHSTWKSQKAWKDTNDESTPSLLPSTHPRLFKSIQRTYSACWNTVVPGPGLLYIILYNYWYQFSAHLPPKCLCLHWQVGPHASMCGFCFFFLIFWWSYGV